MWQTIHTLFQSIFFVCHSNAFSVFVCASKRDRLFPVSLLVFPSDAKEGKRISHYWKSFEDVLKIHQLQRERNRVNPLNGAMGKGNGKRMRIKKRVYWIQMHTEQTEIRANITHNIEQLLCDRIAASIHLIFTPACCKSLVCIEPSKTLSSCHSSMDTSNSISCIDSHLNCAYHKRDCLHQLIYQTH